MKIKVINSYYKNMHTESDTNLILHNNIIIIFIKPVGLHVETSVVIDFVPMQEPRKKWQPVWLLNF